MSSVIIKNDVANNLCQSISALRGDTNKVRLLIGVDQIGEELAAKAVIVNGGSMAEIGFKTSLPVNESVTVEKGKPWLSIILSASDFCSYLSALSDYNADITLSYDGKVVNLSIGSNVNIPLLTFSEENAEPLLTQDYGAAIAKVEADGSFLSALQKGGFLASSGVDSRNLTDRVVFKLADGKCLMYSSDAYAITKAWCSASIAEVAPMRAIAYLRDFGATLEADAQRALGERMNASKDSPEGLVALAKKEGWDESSPVLISLSAVSINAVLKLFSGVEKFMIVVTPNNVHIYGGNVLASFSLAGACSPVYGTSVDKWENNKWGAKVVVERDSFLRALQLLRLGDKTIPFQLTFDANGLAVSKTGTLVHAAVLSSEGSLETINVSLNVEKVIQCVSKLRAGNVIVRIMSQDSTKGVTPISISNGDLTENVNSYAYILPVQNKEENAAEKTAK